MILPIYLYGQPVLRKIAEDITPDYKDLPKLIDKPGNNISYEEGCLSLPGIHENVTRPDKVTVSYLDENFQPQTKTFEGFQARVVQHEYDHLEGMMFIDHISLIRKQLIKSKLNNIVKGKIQCDYKTKAVSK